MTITIGIWILPAFLTVLWFFLFFKLNRSDNDFGIASGIVLLLALPVLMCWAMYFLHLVVINAR